MAKKTFASVPVDIPRKPEPLKTVAEGWAVERGARLYPDALMWKDRKQAEEWQLVFGGKVRKVRVTVEVIE